MEHLKLADTRDPLYRDLTLRYWLYNLTCLYPLALRALHSIFIFYKQVILFRCYSVGSRLRWQLNDVLKCNYCTLWDSTVYYIMKHFLFLQSVLVILKCYKNLYFPNIDRSIIVQRTISSLNPWDLFIITSPRMHFLKYKFEAEWHHIYFLNLSK